MINKHFKTFKELARQTIEERKARNIKNICKYWIEILDDYLGGILENELVVIWASSWVWKTELAIQIALANARRNKKVALFSLEWDIWEIVYRYFQRWINLKLKNRQQFIKGPAYRLNLTDVDKLEQEVLLEIPKEIDNNLFTFDKSFIPDKEKLLKLIADIRDEVDIFIIDHLHYLDFWENEYSWITDIVRSIKELTEIIKKPVVLISHLNRNAWRKKELITKADLHWSSNIEKNANTVILLTPWENDELLSDQEKKFLRSTKIIVDKNRTWMPVPAIFEATFDLNLKEYVDWKKYNSLSTHSANRITERDKIFN